MRNSSARGVFAITARLANDYGPSYASSFLGFLVILSSAGLIGTNEFAWMAAGLAFGGFLVPLTAMGSDLAFVRDALSIQGRGGLQEVVERSFSIRLTVMAVIGCAICIGAIAYAHSTVHGVVIACTALWMGLQGLYPAGWFDYVGATRIQNRLVLLERCVALAGLGMIALLPETLHTGLPVAIVLLMSRSASILIQLWVWARRVGIPSLRIRFVRRASGLGVNVPITVALVANALYIYGNQLFLRGNEVELAAYGLAFQIMGLVFIFQSQAARLWSRQIADICINRVGVIRSTVYYGALIGGGSAALAVIAFGVILGLPMFLSEPKYAVAAEFAPILCLWVIVAGFASSVVQHLVSLKQEMFYLWTSMAFGLAGIVLGAVLVPRAGAMAVAALLLAVQTAAVVVNFSRVRRVALTASPVSTASGKARA